MLTNFKVSVTTIFGFAGHLVTVVTTLLYHCNTEAAIEICKQTDTAIY